jgi:hypothetical protein
LDYIEAVSKGKFFDWRERDFVSAPRRFVRLRPHRDNFMAISHTLPQGGNGSLWCAHENNPRHPC